MTPLRPMLSFISVALLLGPRPAAAQEGVTSCDEFFAEVQAAWGLGRQTQGCNTLGVSDCLSVTLDQVYPESAFYAVEMVDVDASAALAPISVEGGRAVALCSEDSFEPPHITVEEGSRFAMFNAKWRLPEQGQLEDGLRTFIDSAGGRVLVLGSALSSDAVVGSGETALVRIRDSADGVDLRDVYVEGDTIPNLTLIRQEKTNPVDTFSGSIDLTRIIWQNLGDKAALYRPVCTDEAGGGCDSSVLCESFSVTVSDSEFHGAGGEPTLDDAFIRSPGSLTVSGTTLQDVTFADAHALMAAGPLRLEAGTALLELSGPGAASNKAVAYSVAGDVVANTVLAGDLSGWGAILAGWTKMRLEQSYVCGVTDSATLLRHLDRDELSMQVLSSAVVGARLQGGLLTTAAERSSASLNNVLLLNVSKPDGSALESVEVTDEGEGTVSSGLSMTNVLVSDSALAATTIDDATAAAVRLYGSDCGELGLEDQDCAVLSAAPAFTSGELLRNPSIPTCAITSSDSPNLTDFANLMRVEAAVDAAVATGGDVDTTALEALTETLRPWVPALYADQSDLVGAGTDWSESESACGSAVSPDQDHIGAHGGTCSLSFLAPVERDVEVDPDPDPDPDTAGPIDPDGDTGEDGAPAEAGRFGLGSGCRYGSAALILPLALAIRRRRNHRP